MEEERYICYENDSREVYTVEELKQVYEKEVDKNEYADFDCWFDDMIKMQILVKLA